MAAGAEDDGQEKSHDPTPGRLEKAHEQGDIARSQDMQTLAAYIGLAVALALSGTWAAVMLGTALLPTLAYPEALAQELLTGGADAVIPALVGRVGLAALPALALPAVFVLVLLIAQRGVVAVPDKIVPKLDRISPLKNAGQKYGVHGLVEFLKSSVKLAAVSAILILTVWNEFDHLGQYTALPPRFMGPLLADKLWVVLKGVLVIVAIIAAVDFFWQRFDHNRKLRMTYQELKDESKQSEGDPHMKAQRRQRAQEIAQNQMLLAVPKADVLIVNPTHYAVALKWDRAPGKAPVCLAKGVDEIAARIREIARREGIPVHEDPPTARSIHALVEVGRQIPPDQYRAVAAAILFADQMRRKARRSGGGVPLTDGAGP